MNEKTLTEVDLDELEEMAATVESGKMTSALYGTLLPGVFPALVAMARQAPRWIPVEERMPERYGRVAAWTSSGVPEIATWAQHGWLILGYPGEDAISPGDVTHWMPLPAPPEEKP